MALPEPAHGQCQGKWDALACLGDEAEHEMKPPSAGIGAPAPQGTWGEQGASWLQPWERTQEVE